MFGQLFNLRTWLALVAVAIVTGTIFYSNYLAKKIAEDERKKVNVYAESLKTREKLIQSAKLTEAEQSALNLTTKITSENITIPIIETDENDNPSANFLNIDSIL